MKQRRINREELERFAAELHRWERAKGTVKKYCRDIADFVSWLDGRPVTAEAGAAWKACLLDRGLSPVTVNSKLSALNSFFRFMGWTDCHIKCLRIQRKVFRDQDRQLDRTEYRRLVETAKARGQKRLALLLETICATGIRVSELRYITVEAARSGRADVALKGKIRTVLLQGRLCRKLLKYARKQNIAFGEIFLTKSEKSLSRRQIWREMKGLCKQAGVAPSKVFPHNLRHLFATVFYHASRDIVKLADLLGHSSVNTTRIYLQTSGREHVRQLERLNLVT